MKKMEKYINIKVFKVYLKFYIGIIGLIAAAAIVYALINQIEIPILLVVLDIFAAMFLCAIIAFISGRSTRIVEDEISFDELEDFKQHLLQQQFAEKTPDEYYWNRTPVFLLKAVEVKIKAENSGRIKIFVPFHIANWQQTK